MPTPPVTTIAAAYANHRQSIKSASAYHTPTEEDLIRGENGEPEPAEIPNSAMFWFFEWLIFLPTNQLNKNPNNPNLGISTGCGGGVW